MGLFKVIRKNDTWAVVEKAITDCPDNCKIKVDVFNGNGNYVLTEDKDNKIIRTIFDSELIKNVQHVSIMVIDNDNKYPKNRTIKLSFRNITDGEVFANSKVSINHNNNLEVIIKNVDPNMLYEIEVRFNKETKLEKLKKMTKYNLQRMEGDNKVRAKLYDDLMATTSISEYKKIVKESQIKSVYKKRLLEGI